MTEGKCDYCDSENGYWFGNNWSCRDCDRITSYFRITELGREVLRVLLDDEEQE